MLKLILIAVFVIGATPVKAEEEESDKTLIDFEKFPGGTTVISAGTRITTQFSSVGVDFFMTTDSSGPQITRFGLTGQSGVNTLGGDGPGLDFTHPISAEFDGFATCVSVLALDVGENGIVMEAYFGGNIVDYDGVGGAERGDGVGYVDELTVTAPLIDKVVIRQITPGEYSDGEGGGDGYVIDDFEFELVDPNGGFGPNNRPVYLIISLPVEGEGGLEPGEFGDETETYVLNIATFLAGQDIPDTRAEILAVLKDIELPGDLTFEDLNNSKFTVIGSINTFSESSIHMISPSEEDIPTAIQEAFFVASPFLDAMPEFPVPMTDEVAQFIFDVAVGFEVDGIGFDEGDLGPADIQEYVFITGGDLVCTDCQAEGDMFAHDDPDEPLFGVSISIDEDTGQVAADLCLKVKIDLKPGDDKNIINHKSKGKVWCAILTKPGFDAIDEVDIDSVRLGDAAPIDSKEEDADGDGNDDLWLKFNRQDIGLDENTETVELTADTNDGGCIESKASVITVPGGKKK